MRKINPCQDPHLTQFEALLHTKARGRNRARSLSTCCEVRHRPPFLEPCLPHHYGHARRTFPVLPPILTGDGHTSIRRSTAPSDPRSQTAKRKYSVQASSNLTGSANCEPCINHFPFLSISIPSIFPLHHHHGAPHSRPPHSALPGLH